MRTRSALALSNARCSSSDLAIAVPPVDAAGVLGVIKVGLVWQPELLGDVARQGVGGDDIGPHEGPLQHQHLAQAAHAVGADEVVVLALHVPEAEQMTRQTRAASVAVGVARCPEQAAEAAQ